MENKSLREFVRESRYKNGWMTYLYFFFAAIFVSAFMFLSLVISPLLVMLILIPLIILPIMFSFNYFTKHQSEVQTGLTFRNFFTGFRLYYSPEFNGLYRAINTMLVMVVTHLIVSLIASFAISLPMYYCNIFYLKDIVDGLIEILKNEPTAEIVTNYLRANETNLTYALTVIESVPLLFAEIAALFLFDRNSISLFYKEDRSRIPGTYATMMVTGYYKANRKTYLKAYFSLNWYIYLITIFAFALGIFLGFNFNLSYDVIIFMGMLVSLFTYIGIFGGIRYNNKEGLYNYLKDDIKAFEESLKTTFMDSLQKALGDKMKDISPDGEINIDPDDSNIINEEPIDEEEKEED